MPVEALRSTMSAMDTNDTTRDWARAAVAHVLQRCAERAAQDMEERARELLARAAQLRKALP
jgi:hypothetical protein